MEVVASYYRLFLDRALPDELVEERFGRATLALFRQHRFEREGGQPMLQDEAAVVGNLCSMAWRGAD